MSSAFNVDFGQELDLEKVEFLSKANIKGILKINSKSAIKTQYMPSRAMREICSKLM